MTKEEALQIVPGLSPAADVVFLARYLRNQDSDGKYLSIVDWIDTTTAQKVKWIIKANEILENY